MTHEKPSLFVSLGFVIVILARRIIQKNRSPDGPRHDDIMGTYQTQHTTEPKSKNEHQDLHHFPWEPRTIVDPNQNSVKNSDAVHEAGQNDFMSMMTFANQNLRQPSCPCCQ